LVTFFSKKVTPSFCLLSGLFAKESLFAYHGFMLAKLTSKNQLTLPKQAIDAIGAVSHFRVEVDGDRLVLTPERLGAADAVRLKLEELGIKEADIADAVAWSRARRRS
jgi:hypothetical protein